MGACQRSSISTLALVLLAALLQPHSTSACTSFVLEAADGSAVYGRTMEWGTFDLRSRLIIVPRGHRFEGHTPDGKPGFPGRASMAQSPSTRLRRTYSQME